jgi:hypothetical protein
MKKLFQIIKRFINECLNELYQIQKEDLFMHWWRDKK